jgi:hypothetical protein
MATMELASIPREFPQFGRHLSSLVRPASEVFGQQGSRKGKGSCGCGGGKGSCGCGNCKGYSHRDNPSSSHSHSTTVAPSRTGIYTTPSINCTSIFSTETQDPPITWEPPDAWRPAWGKECPCACLDEYKQLTMCITDCGNEHAGTENRAARMACYAACNPQSERYQKCVESPHVQPHDASCCPPPHFNNVGDDHLICGRDITSELVDAVVEDMRDMKVGGHSRWWQDWDWTPLSSRDYKRYVSQHEDNTPGKCGSCGYTFSLCGFCVKADVPANIGSAAVVTGARVREIAGASERLLGIDDVYDFSAYDLGDRWRSGLDTLDYNTTRFGLYATAEMLLCNFVRAMDKTPDSGTNGPSMFRRCQPCYTKFSSAE